MIIFW